MENIEELLNKIENILDKNLTDNNIQFKVKRNMSYFGGEDIVFFISPNGFGHDELNDDLIVSYQLDERLVLQSQAFGGVGGGYIDIKPDNKIHYCQHHKIPFRKPKQLEKNVLTAIDKLCKNYKKVLLEMKNDDKLLKPMNQNVVL